MKSQIPVWIGQRPDIICKAYKKDLFLQPWQQACRIEFRFERVWCIRQGDSLVLKNGGLIKVTRVYSAGKCLVGRDDPYQIGLDYNEEANAFRAALMDRAKEQTQAR